MSEYYNMLIKHMVWINGRELDQLEEVSGAFLPDFGLEKLGCPHMVQCAIANVREEEAGNKRRGEGILFASYEGNIHL
jgi:hypothetical protein